LDLYATKEAFNARLVPVVDSLAAAGVTPDQVSLAALPVAVVGGLCLLASPHVPLLLLVVPVLALLRLLMNLIDGSMARRTGAIHPRGELYNEVGDRVADVAFLAPVAFIPGAWRELVLLGVLGAVLASYVGITSRAAGGERIYRGVLSKPGRMALLAVFCVWALLPGTDPLESWYWFGPLLLAGTLLTFVERTVIAVRRLP
jgi:CDP-diacylglycerol--glycerol-3-phosphate 3-phosphatidyltransferase